MYLLQDRHIYSLSIASSVLCLTLLYTLELAKANPLPKYCDHRLIPVHGASGYQFRQSDHNLRCEGFFHHTTAATFIEIVSLIVGDLSLASNYLRVTPAPGTTRESDTHEQVHLRAELSVAGTNYQMDAQIAVDRTFLWSTELIREAEFTAADVGIYGWVDAQHWPEFVPLMVTPEGLALAPGGANLPVKLVLRSDAFLTVRWRVSPEHEYTPLDTCAATDDRLDQSCIIRPGQTMTFALPRSGEPLIKVDVLAQSAVTGEEFNLTFRVRTVQ